MLGKMILGAALLAAAAVPTTATAKPRTAAVSQVPAAMDFLGALGRLDFDAAAAFLADDVVLELPYAGDGLTLRGKAEVMRFFRRSMGKSVAGIAYKLEQSYPASAAGSFALEISTEGRTAAGLPYTNRLVGIFAFRDGRIVLFREYFNVARMGR